MSSLSARVADALMRRSEDLERQARDLLAMNAPHESARVKLAVGLRSRAEELRLTAGRLLAGTITIREKQS